MFIYKHFIFVVLVIWNGHWCGNQANTDLNIYLPCGIIKSLKLRHSSSITSVLTEVLIIDLKPFILEKYRIRSGKITTIIVNFTNNTKIHKVDVNAETNRFSLIQLHFLCTGKKTNIKHDPYQI